MAMALETSNLSSWLGGIMVGARLLPLDKGRRIDTNTWREDHGGEWAVGGGLLGGPWGNTM